MTPSMTDSPRSARMPGRLFIFFAALFLAPAVALAASKSDAAQSITKAHQYNLGPFKLNFGPQTDGHFGASLKGEKAYLIKLFSSLPKPSKPPSVNTTAWFGYANVDIGVDSGWNSSSSSSNNATISIKPTMTLGAVSVSGGGKIPIRDLPSKKQKVCDQLSKDVGAAIKAKDFAKETKLVGIFRDGGCIVYHDPYHDIAAFSFYPSFQYRYGAFTQNGKHYVANQAVVGAGAKVFFPWQLNNWWASWPFVSVTYYHVINHSGSTIPIPKTIKDDYISAEGKLDVLLPIPVRGRARGLELSIDIKASKATTGVGRNWEVLKSIQLLANIGGNWHPGITYQEGKNGGFRYDKQIIIGFTAELFGR